MGERDDGMRPLARWSAAERARIGYVFTDIDDTLTLDGRLPAVAYAALERLHEAGLKVVPITGRPAGWCDQIARLWPVDAVVGENGALWFRYDAAGRRLERHFVDDEAARLDKRTRLTELGRAILDAVPGTALASDQHYRETDLAIDFCEDVPGLPRAEVARIVNLFEEAGATAKVSSIHVNGWFGAYDKLTMTRELARTLWGRELEAIREACVFVGDSPNDAPMFGFFQPSVGVANLRRFADELAARPTYLTTAEGGRGFAELTSALLDARAEVSGSAPTAS